MYSILFTFTFIKVYFNSNTQEACVVIWYFNVNSETYQAATKGQTFTTFSNFENPYGI